MKKLIIIIMILIGAVNLNAQIDRFVKIGDTVKVTSKLLWTTPRQVGAIYLKEPYVLILSYNSTDLFKVSSFQNQIGYMHYSDFEISNIHQIKFKYSDSGGSTPQISPYSKINYYIKLQRFAKYSK